MATTHDRPEAGASRIDRIGIPRPLLWGFVGLLLFMIGDGVEIGFLTPYVVQLGFSANQAATLLTVYGFTIALAAWFAGALSELISPHRVMLLGAVIWTVFEIVFLVFGIGAANYPIMLLSYGLRGFGYPLFAFGFLVWITAATPSRQLGTAVGWFWFAFTGGLPTLGSLFANATIPFVGQYGAMWASLVLIVLGAVVALVGCREPTGMRPLAGKEESPLRGLLSSVTIAWRMPKIGLGGIVRTINTSSQYAFFVFLPLFFTATVGFSLEQWLFLNSLIYASNIAFNLIFGFVGDRVGWRRTVALFGGIGCAATTLMLYYVPLAVGPNFVLTALVGMLYGAFLAGYVPLSALVPSMVPREQRGSATAILNLGAGLSSFVGPAIVRVFQDPIGLGGVVWVFAGLHALSALIMLFMRHPSDPGESS